MMNGTDSITVLVVDDEEGVRRRVRRIIDGMGLHCLTADGGEKAFEILENEKVGILLLGLKWQGPDGMDMLRIASEKNPHVHVIVLSGFASMEIVIEAMRKGVCDLISKPFEPDQLRNAVLRAMEKMQQGQGLRPLHQACLNTLSGPGKEKSRIHAIIDALPVGVLVTDTGGRVVLINPAFKQQMGLSENIATGETIDHYIPEEDVCRLVTEISLGRFKDMDDITAYEFSPDSDKFLQVRARPVLGAEQDGLGAVITLEDITAMKVIDRLKSEFVAKVSHELRSPLSTIHEQLAVVMSDMVGQASSADTHLLSRAKEKTQGLISLIGDLLDLSRIESGAVCVAPKPVILEDLLENIIDFLSTRAADKKQSLNLIRPKQILPPVKADPLALESIFGNLITNAINYTQDEGRIEVHISKVGINLKVEVNDNGFGIESRHLDKIFDRFYRVKTEKTRYITGTGLGLPIVKGLVDSLGGHISVESTPDQGTTFTVLLPADTDTSS